MNNQGLSERRDTEALEARESGQATSAPPHPRALAVQLRTRSEFSFGETFAPLDRLLDRLGTLGTKAAGLVDTGTWGHVQWAEKASKAGIRPMFGVQLPVVRDLESQDHPFMWFLALSDAGLQELYRFSSRAHRQYLRGPRLSFEDVRAMSGDIAKFSGQVLDGPFLKSVDAYLDLDPGTPIANRKKRDMARTLGLKLVLVSDNYYAAPEDRRTFELIGRQSKPTPQHLLSWPEMVLACGGAIDTRAMIEIVERASQVKLPKAPLIRVDGDLEALARSGIPERFPNGWSEEYEQRLTYELNLIRQKQFESYFLMVADMVRYAKQHMLVGPSRGSAAGSLVCYLTRITEIDPIPSKLIFERFIDVTRKDLPDIDLDFVDSKRHLVLEYLQSKYGRESVAQIGTVTTYQPKSALIAVAKRLGIPPWETNAVKDSIFERSSGDQRANFALLDTLEQTDPGRKLLEKHPAMKHAADIEAHAKNSSVHAAGILVCNAAIDNYCTVTVDGIAQLDKVDAEKLNLLKIDVLGLRTLGVLEDSGVNVDWYALKFNDPATFKVLNDKKFAGVFQFEGPALQSVCDQMTVESLDDIGHITALARPGPMASGGTKDYLLRRGGKEEFKVHPAMEPYVSETFGVVIYQEQVLKICRELGRMSWEDVTLLRKAMSKSLGKEYFDQFRDKFIAGASENGIEEMAATNIWEQVNTMGCVAGSARIRNPFPNHVTPKSIRIDRLARNDGYVRPKAKFKRGPRRDSGQDGPWDSVKRQQLYSLDPRSDTIVPVRCIGAQASGTQTTFEIKVRSGERIRATADHKFFTNRGWVALRDLRVDRDYLAMVGETAPTPRKTKKGTGSGGHNWWFKAKAGKPLLARNLRILRAQYKICVNCRHAPYEETHHINGDHEDHRLRNLMPVCRSCHRRLHGASVPHSKGKRIRWSLLTARGVERIEPVYDVRMPADVQNYEANGFIIHNSWAFNLAHSYSYAVVSYWTAWLKAHHRLEFAAATLRNSKNEESVVALLRELVEEGLDYVAFDRDISDVTWSVKNGKLYGGFTGIKGIGEAKAKALIEERERGGFSEKSRALLDEAEFMYDDLFPTRSRFGRMYTNPELYPQYFRDASKIKISKIADIGTVGEYMFIGRMKGKDLRDHNEVHYVRRREQRGRKGIMTGQTLFLDLNLEDDTGRVLTRIERFDFEKVGRPIWDNAKENTWWLVKGETMATYFNVKKPVESGLKMIYVKKIIQLEDPR